MRTIPWLLLPYSLLLGEADSLAGTVLLPLAACTRNRIPFCRVHRVWCFPKGTSKPLCLLLGVPREVVSLFTQGSCDCSQLRAHSVGALVE